MSPWCRGWGQTEGVFVFSSVHLCVCLFVNMVTPEPLEISSQNFKGICGCKGGQ